MTLITLISLKSKISNSGFCMGINYYDEILAGITLSLLAGGSVGYLTSIPIQYSFGAGAGVSMILIYHGMFKNGPLG